MQILITGGANGRFSSMDAGRVMVSLTILAVLCLMGSAGYAGFYLGSDDTRVLEMELNTKTQNHLYASRALSEEMDMQKMEINTAVLDARENLDALAMRLGVVQARVIRLEAASSRLSMHSGIASEEFNFDQDPAIGGVADPANLHDFNVPDFIQALETLSGKLDEHQHKLSILDSEMLENKVEAAAMPSGNPVVDGWISSGFGKRTDPLTGKHDTHEGLDFAGAEGTEIHAVASGLVTWSGKQKGYGNIVEIDHGQGYVTRYAHNQANIVKVGEKVEKGQTIALMGSTGRSTGNHVHFEVEKDGKRVDPKPYLMPLG